MFATPNYDATSVLTDFFEQHQRVAVLSGAGCSTASGIPEYRDDDGEWKHARPVQFQDFLASADVRRRYWARSFAGWRNVGRARPNRTHTALAELEDRGFVTALITQNVDNLHRAAGSRNVIDLHGVLRIVVCLQCDRRLDRDDMQTRLADANPGWVAQVSGLAPDGDAHVHASGVADFVVPPCENCGGVLKPDVVFFGENVPRERVEQSYAALAESEALLVVGSSLMVFSGFRFVREAHSAGKPVAIVNRGRTRGDDLATIKLEADCGEILGAASEQLAA
ncbi:MAG: NAD-dependent protein deacetylase [Pseudomonadota bacterium]